MAQGPKVVPIVRAALRFRPYVVNVSSGRPTHYAASEYLEEMPTRALPFGVIASSAGAWSLPVKLSLVNRLVNSAPRRAEVDDDIRAARFAARPTGTRRHSARTCNRLDNRGRAGKLARRCPYADGNRATWRIADA
jgi:hypothetical protein